MRWLGRGIPDDDVRPLGQRGSTFSVALSDKLKVQL